MGVKPSSASSSSNALLRIRSIVCAMRQTLLAAHRSSNRVMYILTGYMVSPYAYSADREHPSEQYVAAIIATTTTTTYIEEFRLLCVVCRTLPPHSHCRCARARTIVVVVVVAFTPSSPTYRRGIRLERRSHTHTHTLSLLSTRRYLYDGVSDFPPLAFPLLERRNERTATYGSSARALAVKSVR